MKRYLRLLEPLPPKPSTEKPQNIVPQCGVNNEVGESHHMNGSAAKPGGRSSAPSDSESSVAQAPQIVDLTIGGSESPPSSPKFPTIKQLAIKPVSHPITTSVLYLWSQSTQIS
jgi:hypothetical protein